MQTIAIVIPYFGKKPPLYEVWEQTAIYNSTVDFYLFTDIEEIKEKQNIHVIRQSFHEFRKLIQKVIDFKICLNSPYKICDYRPTFGLAFSKWIGNYDFWGYCDLDMMLGDLRKFFTEDILRKAERCLANGHISLWKNTNRMNNIFRFQENGGGINYQKVFTSPDSFYFDEQRGVYTKCLLNKVIFSPYVPMRDPIINERKFYDRIAKKEKQFIILWENGKLYAQTKTEKQEICYAHFFRRKFYVDEIPVSIKYIKVMPGKIVFNELWNLKDFEYSEENNYNQKRILQTITNSIKRYGILKTIRRQIWTKKSNAYIKNILERHGEIGG